MLDQKHLSTSSEGSRSDDSKQNNTHSNSESNSDSPPLNTISSNSSYSDSDEPPHGLRRTKSCMNLHDSEVCQSSLTPTYSEPYGHSQRRLWNLLVDSKRKLNYFFYYDVTDHAEESNCEVHIYSDTFKEVNGITFASNNLDEAKHDAAFYCHSFFDTYITSCIEQNCSIPPKETMEQRNKQLLVHRIIDAELTVLNTPGKFLKTLIINWKLSMVGLHPHEILKSSHRSDNLPELVTTLFNLPKDASKSLSKSVYTAFRHLEKRKKQAKDKRTQTSITLAHG